MRTSFKGKVCHNILKKSNQFFKTNFTNKNYLTTSTYVLQNKCYCLHKLLIFHWNYFSEYLGKKLYSLNSLLDKLRALVKWTFLTLKQKTRCSITLGPSKSLCFSMPIICNRIFTVKQVNELPTWFFFCFICSLK